MFTKAAVTLGLLVCVAMAVRIPTNQGVIIVALSPIYEQESPLNPIQ